MSQTPQSESLTLADHRRSQEQKLTKERDRKFVKRAISEGYHLLERGQLIELSEILHDLVVRLNLPPTSFGLEHIAAPPGHDIYPAALTRYLQEIRHGADPTEAIQTLGQIQCENERVAASQVLDSIEAVAADRGVLPTELQEVQPVLGYEMQLGERYVRAESQATGEIQLRDPDGELKSILCAGGKGSGKSAAVETLVLDSWLHGHKIVDIVDFFKAENALYDIPQQANGEGLIEARQEMGLDTGFDDIGAGFRWLDGEPDEDTVPSPDLEVLIPVCPGLAEMRIPALNGDNFTVRPFTIPASELTYRQLVMLLHHTTEARENELRSAHQALRDTGRDWTLADVADQVRVNGNANQGVTDAIETSLRTAQEKGFIRDRSCPHALEWDEIMADESTITAFTVHPMQETADHLVVLSYLIDSLFEARKDLLTSQRLSSFPPLSVVMREMHKVAPRSTGESSAESTIENYMIDSLGDMFALTRHANMEVLADTQKFHRQLDPDVSGLFDQILAFSGHIPDVKKIFRTRVDTTRPAEWVAQYKDPGKCAFVSEEGYRLPIQIAPPRSHHLEAKQDGSGLGFRASVDATGEKLVESPWSADVPDRLSFNDVTKHPIEKFFDESVTVVDDRKQFVTMEKLHEAYIDWAKKNDQEEFSQKVVTQRLTSYFEELGSGTRYRPTIDGDRKYSHRRLILSC